MRRPSEPSALIRARAPRVRAPALALALALALASGCAENPSYEVAWALADEEGSTREIDSLRECTRFGIGGVRLTTKIGVVPIDRRDLPCYPPRGDGPELEPGTYEVEIEGLRRSNGQAWGEAVAITRTVDVGDGGAVVLDDVVLPAPPSCDDGVDNDEDGYIDAADADCRFEGVESNLTTSVQFILRPHFLGDNPHVRCGSVGVTTLKVLVDGVTPGIDLETATEEEKLAGRRLDCVDTSVSFGAAFARTDAAEHTVTVVGLDIHGAEVTTAKSTPFTVGESVVFPDASFDAGDFLTPISAPLRFSIAFEAYPGAPARYCATLAGSLVIDTVSITVVDGDEAPVAGVLLQSGEALDGTPLPCPNGALLSETLVWGDPSDDYRLKIEGRSSEGEVCFATDAALRGAPGVDFLALIPRVSATGSCADCASDMECHGETKRCELTPNDVDPMATDAVCVP
ncbi:MAG: hypothetical protein KC420_12275 [Myxococcales bacterium]|nr:hypothetical protein [Myxococcales bacterium]MCB9566106.1 hypothetical protein [Myxococcales bacterium]MCB9703963.1 hypothetical protein [Myxococcales bacterium]